MPKRRLGKGLEAIISSTNLLEIEGEKGELIRLPVDAIRPNPFQPRREFDEERIAELADSIREQGIVQPLVVRQRGDGYELIVGERRLRAARKLGLTGVPCILAELEDRELLELALVENLQREDLNPVEEAMAYQTLMDRFSMNQSDVAEKVGKSRSAVANAIRLLKLPEQVRTHLLEGRLTGGHARAILALDDEQEQIRLAEKILNEHLSVRVVEEAARRRTAGGGRSRAGRQADPRIGALEEALRNRLGTMVRVSMDRAGKGKLEIHFYSEEDLGRLCDELGVEL
jgi:ParB family chromosome partitioning protein